MRIFKQMRTLREVYNAEMIAENFTNLRRRVNLAGWTIGYSAIAVTFGPIVYVSDKFKARKSNN